MSEQLTNSSFKEKIFDYENNKEWAYQGDTPCVIDFYADWCGPCKALSPVIEELSTEYEGKVQFYKINTEQEAELAGAFGIQSIPSLLFVPQKGQPKMAMGALPKDSLKEIIDNLLVTNSTSSSR